MADLPILMPITGRKYKILRYRYVQSAELMTVKVRRIYLTSQNGKVVEFVHNWPLPIREYVPMEEFQERMAVVSE